MLSIGLFPFLPRAPCLTRTSNHLAFVQLNLLTSVVTVSILTEVSLHYIPF